MRPTFVAVLSALLLPVAVLIAVPVLLLAVPDSARAQARLATELPARAAPVSGQIDQIAAVVNNEVITRVELRNRLRVIEGQLVAQNTPLPPRDALERQVLERMIVERAQMQAARSSGLRVDDIQLDRAISRIAEGNKLSVQQLRDRLEAEGTPYARFREEVRDEILLQRLREREVDSKVQVSESDIDSFLAGQKNPGSASAGPRQPEELNIAQILVRVPEGASTEQIEQQRQRADGVMRRLAQGGDFARLSAEFSDAPEALTGGELGWRSEDRLPQLFVDTVNGLKAGEVAAPVKSAAGFHILKLIERRGGTAQAGINAPIKQTRARHILMRVTELVPSSVARQRLYDIKQRVENKSTTFEDMARQYSADGSAQRGGDLGVLLPGDTVPEFERAMDVLKPGEISDPVESPFGWHLIQVVDRTVGDVSQDRQRLLARQALRERKVDEAYQEWLRQTRDRAYVDIRLDDR